MMYRHFCLIFLLFSTITTTGCFDGAACVAGDHQDCLCANGTTGDQTCDVGAVWSICQCGNSGDTLKGNYRINNHLDIDALQPYSTITGDLTITAPGLDTFDLPNLAQIGGNLTIMDSKALINLDGLASLQSIGGSLFIEDTSSLQNVDGLKKLESIGEDLRFEGGKKLDNVNGFENLRSIGGTFHLFELTLIDNLNGFSSLESVGGDLFFWFNESLVNVDGLSNLGELGGGLRIFDHPLLESLDGFLGLSSVGGDLYTWNNDSLTNLDGYSNITEIGGSLCFSNDDYLEDVSGLSGITHVKGDFWVFLDHSLKSLHGVHNIKTIDRHAYIGWESKGNPHGTVSLRNLDDFSSLEKVGGDLIIVHNLELTDITGLKKFTMLGRNFLVYHNHKLPTCQVTELLERLQGLGWDLYSFVENNAMDECYQPPGSQE